MVVLHIRCANPKEKKEMKIVDDEDYYIYESYFTIKITHTKIHTGKSLSTETNLIS